MNYRLCTLLLAHLQFNFRLFRFGDMLLLFGTGAFMLHCINTNHLFRAQLLITGLL